MKKQNQTLHPTAISVLFEFELPFSAWMSKTLLKNR